MTALKRYNSYTLIEMLIVLAIFIIIATIGFSAFYGLKDSITMNEKILTMSQDFREAQRAALFLERDSNERWLYGIGIDFSSIRNDGKYRLFKWCSQFSEYGDARTRANLPNYIEGTTVTSLNGNLPVPQNLNGYALDCQIGGVTSELARIPDSGDRSVVGFTVDLPSSNNASGDQASFPSYILFESVSGRTFFYDSAGNIVNYNSSGDIVASPIGFKVYLQSDRTKTRKTISISNISGKVDVKTEKIQ